VRQPFDTRLELDERPELGEARHPAGSHLAHLVGRLHRCPGIGGELLQSEGDFLGAVVDAQHLDGDLLAGCHHLRDVRHAGPSHFRYVEQALHAGAQVDEGAELAHRGDAAGHDGTGHDGATNSGSAGPLLLFEQRAPRQDNVPAAFFVFDDPELIDAPHVLRRIRGADGIDL